LPKIRGQLVRPSSNSIGTLFPLDTRAHGGIDDKRAGDAIARGEKNGTAEKSEDGTDSSTAASAFVVRPFFFFFPTVHGQYSSRWEVLGIGGHDDGVAELG